MREIKIKLYHEHFPVEGVDGMTSQDNGDNYMVIINKDLSQDEQAHAFLHEMLHIYNDDFSRAAVVGVDAIEKQNEDQLRSLGF